MRKEINLLKDFNKICIAPMLHSWIIMPLKKVITYADENLIKYIQNQTCNSVMKFCAENFQNNTPGRYRGVEF